MKQTDDPYNLSCSADDEMGGSSLMLAIKIIVGAALMVFVGYLYGVHSTNEALLIRAIDNGWAAYKVTDIYTGATELVWQDGQ